MKKKKIIVLITSLLSGIMILSFTAWAASDAVYGTYGNSAAMEDVRINDIEELSVAERYFCSNCGGYMWDTCSGYHNYEGVGTHGYGFLWQDKCTYYSFSAKGGKACEDCYAVEWYDGEHHCLEIHLDCGRGNVNMCPF